MAVWGAAVTPCLKELNLVSEISTVLAVLDILIIGSASPAEYNDPRIRTPNFRSTFSNRFKETKLRENPIPRIIDVSLEKTMFGE
jgi:hypothetical protein